MRKEGPLHQMRARYYDPMTARFLSRDPLAPRFDDLKSTNRYAYASQNPMRYIDPYGEDVQISGYGRFGLDYSGGSPPPPASTQVNSRLRFNIDASMTTDSGVTFGGRIRMQYDSPDEQRTEYVLLNAAELYAEAGGLRLDAGFSGYVSGSLTTPYKVEFKTTGGSSAVSFATGNGMSGLGIYASYSVGDLVARIGSVEYASHAEPGFQCGKADTSKSHPFLYTMFATSDCDEAAPPSDLGTGSGFTYDLGGATIGGTIQKNFNDSSFADLGVRFSF